MTYHRPARTLACGLLALMFTLGGRAHAVDGVIEINQARANKGGITPGDTPGFPITISTGTFLSEPMSFRLTGPLFNTTTSNIIEILSPDVTVDLNGFTITCLIPGGAPQSPQPASGGIAAGGPPCAGIGILSSQSNITVMNGTVSGFFQGVELTGTSGRIENVRALGNSFGLHVGDDCIVRNNVANGNTSNGIIVGDGCTVTGNTANHNGGDGICTHVGCTVIGNTVLGNTGHGLNLSTLTGYSQNVISNNTGGTVVNGVPTGLNVCNGSTTCP